MTSAISGASTLFKKGATAVGEVTKVSGVGINRDTIEATHLSSTAQWREFFFGLLSGTDITIELNYIPQNATHKAILTDVIAATSATYSVTLPSGTDIFSMTLLPFAFELGDIEPGAKLTASGKFKVSGAVTQPT